MNMMILPHAKTEIEKVDAIESVHASAKIVMDNFRNLGLSAVADIQPMPIGANCLRTFKAVHNSGRRPVNEIWWMVLHDEEAFTARSAAAWFQNPDSAGSAHLCNDDRECYRCLDDSYIPWGAQGANYHGLHFEQAGFASWSRTNWTLEHHMTLDRTAFKVAYHIKKYRENGIKVDFIDHRGLQQGKKGITTHAECTKAFGGSHTDPGAGYPIDVFMARCEHFYAALTHKQNG